VVGLSSGTSVGTPQIPVSTPKEIPNLGFLSIAPWQYTPSFLVYAEVTKDSRKMLLKLGKDGDNVARWLKTHVGSLVTIYVPQFGIAWTPTLAERKRWGYLYVRIPSKPAAIKKLFEPVWKAGIPIPVIISIPPISLVPPQDNQPTEKLKDGIKPVQG
jgi:hypothetical protein